MGQRGMQPPEAADARLGSQHPTIQDGFLPSEPLLTELPCQGCAAKAGLTQGRCFSISLRP